MSLEETFLFLVPCAINKSLEGLVYLLEPCFPFRSWLSHSFFFGIFLILLNEIIVEHVCFVCLYAHCLLCGSCVELWYQSCVDLVLWYNLDNLLLCHTLVCLLDFLGVLFKSYLLLGLESCVHALLLYVYFMTCLLSLIQYIGETPSNPKSAKMCMKFNFISICTYLCGVWDRKSVV